MDKYEIYIPLEYNDTFIGNWQNFYDSEEEYIRDVSKDYNFDRVLYTDDEWTIRVAFDFELSSNNFCTIYISRELDWQNDEIWEKFLVDAKKQRNKLIDIINNSIEELNEEIKTHPIFNFPDCRFMYHDKTFYIPMGWSYNTQPLKLIPIYDIDFEDF